MIRLVFTLARFVDGSEHLIQAIAWSEDFVVRNHSGNGFQLRADSPV